VYAASERGCLSANKQYTFAALLLLAQLHAMVLALPADMESSLVALWSAARLASQRVLAACKLFIVPAWHDSAVCAYAVCALLAVPRAPQQNSWLAHTILYSLYVG
jgi:hypothetical protein